MKNLFLLILLLLTSFACTLFKSVNVPSERVDVQEKISEVESGLGKITADLTSFQGLADKWPDAEFKKRLAKLTQSQQFLIQYYIRMKEDFESSKYKDRGTIPGDDPDYEAAKKEQLGFETHLKNLDQQLSNYRTERNSLKDYTESKQVYKVDVQKVNQDFIPALNEAKKTQLNTKNNLMDYNVKLNQSSLTDEQKKPKKVIVQELVKIVERMENETFRLQRHHAQAVNEVGTGVKFITPGMKSFGYLNVIKIQTERIKQEEINFNNLAKTLDQN